MYEKDGISYSRECSCMAKRRSIRRIKNSGIADMVRRYTFDAYETPDKTRENVKNAALRYVDGQGWFYIAGRSGSGKTHICTAICSALMEKGLDIAYLRWRDDSAALKSVVNDAEYEPRVDRFKRVPVLYIDDFLKGGSSEADIRLAFEILNARYNDTAKRTVISSELDIQSMMEIDEALGSRIYERSRGFCLQAPRENWRLR